MEVQPQLLSRLVDANQKAFQIMSQAGSEAFANSLKWKVPSAS
jgi:hypothetical protein